MIRNHLKTLTIEELANTLTHGFGLVLSLFGFVLLVYLAGLYGGFWHIFSCAVYGLSLVVLYAASTFYHSTISAELKEKLRLLDHCCIYLLIAGTYTPFTLIALRGSFGSSLFAFVWFFALIGIGCKIFLHNRFKAASVISYLIMGWIGLIAVHPLYQILGVAPLILVVAGGLVYSVGVIFFAWEGFRHHHAIWHLFVLAGSVFHFLAISIYVVPYVTNL